MSKREVIHHLKKTRGELSATLDEIERRVQPEHLVKTTVSWVSGSYDRFPARWLSGLGIAVVAGLAALFWAIFGSDDD